MRFLADENVPRAAVDALRAAGHDLAWIRTDAPGARDEEVLERSRSEARVLLTQDKDFGELVLRRGRDASQGVILLRLPVSCPAGGAQRQSVCTSRCRRRKVSPRDFSAASHRVSASGESRSASGGRGSNRRRAREGGMRSSDTQTRPGCHPGAYCIE